MEPFVRNFIKASLVWLGVGITIGVSMAFAPGETLVYRPAHAHANLLGFVSMMIFGVAYHVIPRFSGNPLHSRTLPQAQWLLQNAGLAAMVLGFLLRPLVGTPGIALVAAGAIGSSIGAFLFIYNIWRTLDGVRVPGLGRT